MPPRGLEPRTNGLKVRCSTVELEGQGARDNSPDNAPDYGHVGLVDTNRLPEMLPGSASNLAYGLCTPVDAIDYGRALSSVGRVEFVYRPA